MPTNIIICKRTGMPCSMCMYGWLDDVTKCKYRITMEQSEEKKG